VLFLAVEIASHIQRLKAELISEEAVLDLDKTAQSFVLE
jgi:hypothetical protein